MSVAAGSNAAAARRPRARKGEGARLRAEILAAAERLLVERGHADGVTIRAIADAVGVTPPAIYLHFPDRDALVFAVAAEQFARLDRAVTRAIAGIDDPVEALRAAAHAYVQFGLRRPAEYRVLYMTDASRVPPGVSVDDLPGMGAFREVVAVVERGIATGRFRPVDPWLAVTGLWTAVHGLVSQLVLIGPRSLFRWPPRRALVDHLVDVHLRGLAP